LNLKDAIAVVDKGLHNYLSSGNSLDFENLPSFCSTSLPVHPSNSWYSSVLQWLPGEDLYKYDMFYILYYITYVLYNILYVIFYVLHHIMFDIL